MPDSSCHESITVGQPDSYHGAGAWYIIGSAPCDDGV